MKRRRLNQKGTYVYVVKDDTATLRQVTLGQQQGDMVVVESSEPDKCVNPGEQVMVAGQLMVINGGKVRIEGESPASGACHRHARRRQGRNRRSAGRR